MNKTAVQLRNEKELKGLQPDFAKLITSLLDKLWEIYEPLGFYPMITDGNRTLKEQKRLYAQGRTTEGKIVTWTLNSKHIGGRACDFGFISVNDGNLNYSVDYSMLGESVRSIDGLEWGYDLWGRDKPHVQYNPSKAEGVQGGHWSDESMEWAEKHQIITQKKDPSAGVTWGELVVFAQRLAKQIMLWAKNNE